MSTIQSDQDVINEGRAGTMQDIEAPLRDQIDKKLLRALREDEFAQKVVDAWEQGNADRAARLQRRQEYLSDWDDFVPKSAEDEEYAGTSNLHIPVTFTVLKTYHARILQALLANMPAPRARRPDSLEREKMIEEVMKYTIKDWANEYEGVESVLDSWVWEWAGYGSGTLKNRWEAKYEKFVDVSKRESIRVVRGVDENGSEIAVPEPFEEEFEEERVVTCFEGPVTEFVPEEDLVVVGGEGCPQKADLVAHSQWLTASELWTLVDRKIFDSEAVKKIIAGGDNSKSRGQAGGIKLQKAQLAGQAQIDKDSDKDRYMILETYTGYDVDGDGIDSQIVAWIHPDSREICRATYLRRINRTGKRPFFTAEFHRRPGADHPIGLIEVLYPLAKEMDAIHNMRIDTGILASMPFGFYRASSSLKPETIKYEPGSLIPVDDPSRDVFFPNLGNRTTFGMQEEMAIQSMVERLTGISDLTLGALSGAQGPTRTATGVRGLIGEANANLDVHLKRLFRAWRQYLRHLLSMLQQRIPPGLSFRVTGDDGQAYWRWIQSQDQIAGDYDFEIDPSSADSNPQVRQEKAMQIFNTVMNPLLIQLGVVSPGNIFAATKNLLSSADIKDWAKFITQPPEYAVTLTPQEEVQRVLLGMDTPVTLNGDHEGFIRFFEHIMGSPELLGQYDQQSFVRLAQQAQRHQQMLAAIEQMKAQQANIGQMRMNAAQSQQQAPAALNPMSGAGQVMPGA